LDGLGGGGGGQEQDAGERGGSKVSKSGDCGCRIYCQQAVAFCSAADAYCCYICGMSVPSAACC
jgi:hypothetical protein